MNELFVRMIKGEFLMYASYAAGILCCLIQLILAAVYHQSLRASDSIRSARAVWMRQMRIRFESFQQWNHGVRNTDVFVDRHISRRKLLGVSLVTWEEVSRLMIPVSVLMAFTAAASSYAFGREGEEIIFRLLTGAFIGILLKCIVTCLNLKEKRFVLRMNLRDYFENVVQHTKNAHIPEKVQEPLHTQDLGEEWDDTEYRKEEQNSGGDSFQSELACSSDSQEEKKETHPMKAYVRQNTQNKGIHIKKKEEKANRKDLRAKKKAQKKKEKERLCMEKLHQRMQKMQQRLGDLPETRNSAAVYFAKTATTKEEEARAKREELKRKVDIPEEEEDKIISEVLKEFLA